MIGGGLAFGMAGALAGYVLGMVLGQLLPGPGACGVVPRAEDLPADEPLVETAPDEAAAPEARAPVHVPRG